MPAGDLGKRNNRKRIKHPTQRKTSGYGGGHNVVPYIEPRHFKQAYQPDRRIPTELLRAAMRTAPVRRAIERIADGIFAMNFTVHPPKGKEDSEEARDKANSIKEALMVPNWDDDETYYTLLYKVIAEMLGLGFACVEKQMGNEDKLFWLWVADGSRIAANPKWSPGSDEPRFFERGHYKDSSWGAQKPFMEDEMFLFQKIHASHEMVPPSPVEIAFPHICSWLGLHNFQQETTSRATSQYMLDLGDVSQEELSAFRSYWKNEIEGTGNTPIAAGKGQIGTTKIGARNDSELFHQYDEKLLRLIASCFNLSPRNYGVTEKDNRATAGVAADADFQDAVLPYAYCFFGTINAKVLNRWFPGFRIEINDTEPRTETQEVKIAVDLYKAGLITKNEARLRAGHEDLEQVGDRFKDGSTLEDPEPAEGESPPNNGTNQKQSLSEKEAPTRGNKEKKDMGSKVEQK